MRRGMLIWFAMTMLFAPWLYAQGGDKATAEILFNDGRRLMQEGKFDVACDKLAESQRLDPAVGTLLNLAECQEKQGRTASAWATWLEAAAGARQAGQTDREGLARQRAEALRPRLVTLTIEVPEANRIAGLSVTRNGTALGPTLWGTAAPVDPGTHNVTASAPGHHTWTTEVVVREGSPASVVVPPLTAAPQAAPATAALAPPPSGAAIETPPPSSVESHGRSGPPVATYVLGGVGIVGLGVGTIFGLQAKSKNDDSKEFCSTDTLCEQEGVDLRDEAFTAATVSTVGFAVGAASLAAGAVVWIVSAKGQSASATRPGVNGVAAVVLPGSAGFALEGAF